MGQSCRRARTQGLDLGGHDRPARGTHHNEKARGAHALVVSHDGRRGRRQSRNGAADLVRARSVTSSSRQLQGQQRPAVRRQDRRCRRALPEPADPRGCPVWMSWVGLGCVDAFAGVAFSQPARRTGRVCLHASGSPRAQALGLGDECWRSARPGCREVAGLVAVTADCHCLGLEQPHVVLGRSSPGKVAAWRTAHFVWLCRLRIHRTTRCQVYWTR